MNYDLSLFDVGHAEAALQVDNGEFKCGAFASAGVNLEELFERVIIV